MSVHYDAERAKYVVHWREEGRQRKRRFDSEAEALAFDGTWEGRHSASPPKRSDPGLRGDSIYPYLTTAGERWRFVFRQSDGKLSSRRGFTSRRAAATARRRFIEAVDRGEVKVSRSTFGEVWAELLEDKRRYLTPGSHQDFVNHGRKRLLPFSRKPVSHFLPDMRDLPSSAGACFWTFACLNSTSCPMRQRHP